MPQRGNLPLFDVECTVPSSSEQDVLQLFRNYNSTYGEHVQVWHSVDNFV